MGVFMDWLSLCQKDEGGVRQGHEQLLFEFALTQTMDVWYAHQTIPVVCVSQLPPSYTTAAATRGQPLRGYNRAPPVCKPTDRLAAVSHATQRRRRHRSRRPKERRRYVRS
jgi:hypothetical protein